MIKAEELMIGDWVLDGTKYAQVTSITCDGIIETTVNKKSNIELLEPIPITSEILEKNGFKGIMYAKLDIDQHQWIEYYYHEHRLRKWWRGIDEWNNHAEVSEVPFECQCHYVHELQMAFKLCKVNKEIVL